MKTVPEAKYREVFDLLENKFLLAPLKRLIEKGQYPGTLIEGMSAEELQAIANDVVASLLEGELDEDEILTFLFKWKRKTDENRGYIVDYEALEDYCIAHRINLYRLLDEIVLENYAGYEHCGNGIRIQMKDIFKR